MRSRRILVAEDERIVVEDIKECLIGLGYDVTGIVSRGNEAIDTATSTYPDAVLMDIRLKGDMDGIEAAEIIQSKLSIPVIYLTAHADDSTLERAKKSEPYGYILKPFESKELHTTIEIALLRHRQEVKLKKSEHWLATTLKSISEALVVTDPQGNIIYQNPKAQKLTCCSDEQMGGRQLNEIILIPEEVNDNDRNPALTVMRTGTPISLENLVIKNESGDVRIIDTSIAPIKDETGIAIGAVAVLREKPTVNSSEFPQVTPGVFEAESHLLFDNEASNLASDAAKIASLGIMTTGITHEISHPLHAILIHANSALYWHERNKGVIPEVFMKKLNNIADCAERINDVVRHMQSFWDESAHINADQLVNNTDLNISVADAMRLMASNTKSHGIKPEIVISDEVIPVQAKPYQVEQIAVNLITDAITALDESKSDEKWMRISTRRDGIHAIMEISDGCESNSIKRAKSQSHNANENKKFHHRIAVAKSFMKKLDGTIEGQHNIYGGIDVTVKLPLDNTSSGDRR
ncbi:hypothetical protein CEE37_01750 [candidate division LCP-89 bacterium B3_LCP]|uniref:histidine kinase n=1 Tax=candidate division LCP-89 bacterium B3_LCP TaxID=2012998 RepID=A0A532V5G6_UNCL8|nr:MAG: hypothetical protein CEE37_01750 [candidate division LCP-89 bacterium B3_LCP]